MLQITAASNKHLLKKVPESAVLVVCHSPEEHQISPDILTVSSQTPVPQFRGDLIEKGIASFTSPSSLNDTSELKPFSKQVQVELYCHFATCVDIQWN